MVWQYDGWRIYFQAFRSPHEAIRITALWNTPLTASHFKFIMSKPRQLLFLGLAILFFSCRNDNAYPFAIKDFRKSLQPHLIKIVSEGIVMSYDSSLRNMATDRELMELSRSEHPVLRASAYMEILERKSFNHFDVLMENLDDRAFILSDEGEFGISRRTISDDILRKAKWRTDEAKSKTVEKVLTKYNYLRSAYLVLTEIKPQEKYYPFIKDMATRPRWLSPDGYELGFNDIEFALYGLAKFRKAEDVEIIKQQMMKQVWMLSNISFELMEKYPDTAYLDVLEAYHRRQFYEFSGNRRDGFTGYHADRADPEDFIHALSVQQNERSARLFDTLLIRLHSMPCMPDKKGIEDEVVRAIWEHPAIAYASLREKTKTRAKEVLRQGMSISIPIDRHNEPVDTTIESIRWYQ